MKIEGNTIIFKSDPYNFYKERDNAKCNTVRRFESWEELRDFLKFKELFESKYSSEQTIRVDGGTEGFFERTITDITKFEGYFIISWKAI